MMQYFFVLFFSILQKEYLLFYESLKMSKFIECLNDSSQKDLDLNLKISSTGLHPLPKHTSAINRDFPSSMDKPGLQRF